MLSVFVLTCTVISVGTVVDRIDTSHAGVWSVTLDDDLTVVGGAVVSRCKDYAFYGCSARHRDGSLGWLFAGGFPTFSVDPYTSRDFAWHGRTSLAYSLKTRVTLWSYESHAESSRGQHIWSWLWPSGRTPCLCSLLLLNSCTIELCFSMHCGHTVLDRWSTRRGYTSWNVRRGAFSRMMASIQNIC